MQKVSTLKVQTLEHFDVKGKKLCYVIITSDKLNAEGNMYKQVYINVGEKNFEAVTELINEDNEEKEEANEIEGTNTIGHSGDSTNILKTNDEKPAGKTPAKKTT